MFEISQDFSFDLAKNKQACGALEVVFKPG